MLHSTLDFLRITHYALRISQIGAQQISNRTFQTKQPVERAILVGIETSRPVWSIEDSLAELEQLAATAGVEVLGQVSQKVSEPNPATLVGKGKVKEIAHLKEELGADLVLFDEELTPGQQRNLEETLNTKILDRT